MPHDPSFDFLRNRLRVREATRALEDLHSQHLEVIARKERVPFEMRDALLDLSWQLSEMRAESRRRDCWMLVMTGAILVLTALLFVLTSLLAVDAL